MNKIYKVIYSKVRQCYVVVSEIARSHGKGAKSEHAVKGNSYSRQLAVAVALAISCGGLLYPTQAEADVSTNDYFTAYDKNYFDKDGNRSKDWSGVKEFTNSANAVHGSVEAKGTGAIAAGTFAQAGQQTITLGIVMQAIQWAVCISVNIKGILLREPALFHKDLEITM